MTYSMRLMCRSARWRRFLAARLQHTETSDVENTQVTLHVRETRFGDRRQRQPVVLEVRETEEDETRERVRHQVAEDDLSDVAADVDEGKYAMM
jgi:hypothetical protein